jgi:Trypsin-like peptidase domain
MKFLVGSRMVLLIAVCIIAVGVGAFWYDDHGQTAKPPAPIIDNASTSVSVAASTMVSTTISAVATSIFPSITVAPQKLNPLPPSHFTTTTPISSAASTSITSISVSPVPLPPSSSASTSLNTSIATIPIEEAPNVGLLCHYKINDPALKEEYEPAEDSNGEMLAKGSGVIVNPQGYILTAKHIVDPEWATIAYAGSMSSDEVQLDDALSLDYCDVGMPQNELTPSITTLQSDNPSIAISNPFPYVATLVFEPSKEDGLSEDEYEELDFAVLKISGPLKNCQTFNLCTLPSSFPYSPVLYSFTPDQSSEPNVFIDFGYPAESINSTGGSFTDFYLKGAVGRLTTYYDGDAYFNNEPFVFEWQANDVLPGRSGSPVYWQGYVVGIETGGAVENSTLDYAVGMPAIEQTLQANGWGNILMTH